jgi:hypothetical protein
MAGSWNLKFIIYVDNSWTIAHRQTKFRTRKGHGQTYNFIWIIILFDVAFERRWRDFQMSVVDLTSRNQRLYLPSDGAVLRIFIARKNPLPSAGFEPANLRSNDEHAN